jgi:hypothetical protein
VGHGVTPGAQDGIAAEAARDLVAILSSAPGLPYNRGGSAPGGSVQEDCISKTWGMRLPAGNITVGTRVNEIRFSVLCKVCKFCKWLLAAHDATQVDALLGVNSGSKRNGRSLSAH